jgi:glucose dehydrogenase
VFYAWLATCIGKFKIEKAKRKNEKNRISKLEIVHHTYIFGHLACATSLPCMADSLGVQLALDSSTSKYRVQY